MNTYRIEIEGTVQGVGFRPFIFGLASHFKLFGTVSNGSAGVEIYLNTTDNSLANFLESIQNELPPLACVDKIKHTQVSFQQFSDFKIIATTEKGEKTVRIPPDVSVCTACEKELFDPQNRRFSYPFITCTHCGVRYSIVHSLPYDRSNTSMKFFEMCKNCEEEYKNPLNRRYHAQPIGCFDCGPRLELKNKKNTLDIKQEDIIDKIVCLLDEGNIVAVKGVGGYHLMCDAMNEKSILELRKRKNRPAKPFAVMVQDISSAKKLAKINKKEEEILVSYERPIVLLDALYANPIIAPNISRIGIFLAYTPLHLLILKKLGRPLIATSANVTDEPICTDIKDLQMLIDVYDYALEHNREIVNGCDDSIVMVVKDEEVILRRARGYAPASIKLPFELKRNVLAFGANQKSSLAIGFDNQAILSPHIGDLSSIGSLEYYKNNITTLQRMYSFKPEVIAYDKHPRYESSKIAKQYLNKDASLFDCSVQHHYAHILSTMAEKGLNEKVFGVAFDGTGFGDDGNLWGGEFLLCDYKGFERLAHLNYFKLLGGSKAIKEPCRVALSLLFELYGKKAFELDSPTVAAFSKLELSTYFIAWEKGLNSPLTSSVGRLFDAVASLLGVVQKMSFEGQSGMLLEEIYDETVEGYYRFEYKDTQINILPMLKEMIEERDVSKAVSKFFHTLVEIIARVYKPYDLPLVLSGGVFQNKVLLELLLDRFPKAIISKRIPPNDGGIALGQVAASLLVE